MEEYGFAEYVRIYSETADKAKWQSRFHGQIVDGYDFLPFTSDGLVVSATGVASSASLTFPLRLDVRDVLRAAAASGWLVEVRIRRFPIANATANNSIDAVQTTLATFLGEITGGEEDGTKINISLGSALSPLNILTPPRRYTTALVGTPPVFA
jgi:hypothetical protein